MKEQKGGRTIVELLALRALEDLFRLVLLDRLELKLGAESLASGLGEFRTGGCDETSEKGQNVNEGGRKSGQEKGTHS